MNMSTMKDGGPAHPVTEMQAVHAYAMAVSLEAQKAGKNSDEAYIAARGAACTGMTLRDHFAGLAMQGMVSAEFAKTYDLESWANSAYLMADAMLKARNGGVET